MGSYRWIRIDFGLATEVVSQSQTSLKEDENKIQKKDETTEGSSSQNQSENLAGGLQLGGGEGAAGR